MKPNHTLPLRADLLQNIRLLIGLSLLALLLFTSCKPTGSSSLFPQTNTKAMDSLQIVGCPDSITLRKGDIVVIKLPATEATGFIWQVKSTHLLRHTNADNPDEYEALTALPAEEPPLVGKAVRQVLRFQATHIGAETMELIYARPFGQKEVADSCRIKVSVE